MTSDWRIRACNSLVRALATLAALSAAPARLAAGDPSDFRLLLRAGDVDLHERPSLLAPGAAFEAGKLYVIHLDGPMTPARRSTLQAAGVVLHPYLPIHAFLADLSGADADALIAAGFVDWVGVFDDDWKISPAIAADKSFSDPDRRRLEAAGKKLLIVETLIGSKVGVSRAALRGLGGDVKADGRRGDRRQFVMEIDRGRVDALKGLSGAFFVDEAPEVEPRNATTSWIVQTNVTNVRSLWDAGLRGENQVAGIIDWDMRADHCAFDDPGGNPIGPLHRKILAYYGMGVNPGFGWHGTHVGGTFVGDELAETNPDLRGLAYKSKVVFQHYNGVLSGGVLLAFDRLEIAHNDGARVHNNSWGSSATTYNAHARDIDLFARTYEDDLVLVAVANGGASVQSPENAKNCLAVSGGRDTPNQHQFCIGTSGPTADGRRKPDVMAPACNSRSADVNNICGNDDTGAGGGTSYATPAVAGMAVLVRQYFTAGFYPTGVADAAAAFTPSGALLKAMMVNSAVDMTGITGYPSNQEGWGRVLTDNTVYLAGDERRLLIEDMRNADGFSTGQSRSHYVVVGPAAQALRISLVWTDEPAALFAGFTPINNLDLVATSPSELVYRGNVFSSGQSTTGGAADTLNNVEQVHLNAPETGLWRIDVDATAVNVGTQGYALVVTGDVGCLKADVSGDGQVNSLDIQPFVDVILGGGTFFQRCSADMNDSGTEDELDVDEFVGALLF